MANQQLTEEQQAVMDVIICETASAYNRDFSSWEPCWAHEPSIRRMGWLTISGITDVWGWEQLRSLTLQDCESGRPLYFIAEQVFRENLVLHIDGDLAYATFDEYAPRYQDKPGQRPQLGRAGRVLRRIEGRWRLVFSSFLSHIPGPVFSPLFRVTANGNVSWMNDSAELVVRKGNSLSVVAGRLCANTAATTKAIRTAIRDASKRDNTLNSGRISIPVLLEQADDVVCVCWVVTEGAGGGSVLVSLNNLDFVLDKIDAAAALFGLSPAQRRLAEHIASGHDVVASASLLGITASTARTHLQRIYDKTGAHNQAALVRTLLSIGGPE